MKILKNLKKRIRNTGSGLVLVVVALGFVGILVGALLTAAKLLVALQQYEYNARDNFNYLQQAMNRIYQSIGENSNECMQEAYEDTLKYMVVYNATTNTYDTRDDAEVNEHFKDTFMAKLVTSSTLDKTTLARKMQDVISGNEMGKPREGGSGVETTLMSRKDAGEDYSITLNVNSLAIIAYDLSGHQMTLQQAKANSNKVGKFVIRGVELTRTVDYARSAAGRGKYRQTISTDIVISRPTFDVRFDVSSVDSNSLFDYCIIADSGVEIDNTAPGGVTLSGNVYAASDFYNKDYNNYDGNHGNLAAEDLKIYQQEDVYHMNKVSNYSYDDSTKLTTLFNKNQLLKNDDTYRTTGSTTGTVVDNYLYDGENQYSKYSGIYVNGTKVLMVSGKVIVPGTVSVMNAGTLTLSGINGAGAGNSEMWVDNLYLGGTSNITSGTTSKGGAVANINANLYVRDDTTIDAEGAELKINGSYFGYSNSTTSDKRTFVPTTAKDSDGNFIYQEVVTNGNETIIQNRGHYNSSAMIVNGQDSTLDISDLNTLYIAGRSYIELSRQKNGTKYDENNNIIETYQYNSKTGDYKTGESISVRSTQLAYIPLTNPSADDRVEGNTYLVDMPDILKTANLFTKYFGYNNSASKIPVIMVTENVTTAAGTTAPRTFCYFDFSYAAKEKMYDPNKFDSDVKADDLSASFIKDYMYYFDYFEKYKNSEPNIPTDVDTDIFNTTSGVLVDLTSTLKDVTNYSSFKAGEISLASADDNTRNYYASGVLTKALDTDDTTGNITFGVETASDTVVTTLSENIDATGSGIIDSSYSTGTESGRLSMSDQYLRHYNYLKWNLSDIVGSDSEATFINSIVNDANYGEAALTPINKFFNFEKIHNPSATAAYVDEVFGTDHRIIISDSDVTIKDNDSDGIFNGIVITKGDVFFDPNVKTFNGLIVSGGKVYIDSATLESINASSLSLEAINACMVAIGSDKDEQATKVLGLFKSYQGYITSTSTAASTQASADNKLSITQIDYTNYMGYENWMKNVEYDNWYNQIN